MAIQMKKKTTMNQNTAGAIFTSFAECLFCLSSFCVLCPLLTVSGLSIRSTQYMYYANLKKEKKNITSSNSFHGDTLHNIKRKKYKTIFAELPKNTSCGPCNMLYFVYYEVGLLQYSRIALNYF
jgi:hypothetical protein